MHDSSDRLRALNYRLHEEHGNISALSTTLGEIERWVTALPEQEGFDLLAHAYYQLREATGDAPDQAQTLILVRLLPWLIGPDQPEAADYARARGRETLREWLDQYPDAARAPLVTQVLDALHDALVVQGASPTASLCWTISAVGHRRSDIVDRLFTVVDMHNDEIGDAALCALAKLHLGQEQRQRALHDIHTRLNRRMAPVLITAVAVLSDPSSVAPLRKGLEELLGEPEPSFAYEYGIQTLAGLAGAHPENADLQDSVWMAILAQYHRAPERSAFSMLLGSDFAPKCDARTVVHDVLGLVAEHSGDDEGAVHRRRLLYLRVSECIRPRQLAGAGDSVSASARDLLRLDAARNTTQHGLFATSASLSKESAWTALLHRGDPIVLDSDFFGKAVLGEESGYLRGNLMERLAAFRWVPLPQTVIELITQQIDLNHETASEELPVRKGATLMARSAATREAFEALLRFGFTFQGHASRDSATALASVALRLARRNEAGITEALIAALAADRARHQRLAALQALAMLASEGLLADRFISSIVDVAIDHRRELADRSGALDVLATLPADQLEPGVREVMRQLALGDDEVAGSAIEALAQCGALIEMPDAIERHLPLHPVGSNSIDPPASIVSSDNLLWEYSGTTTSDWTIGVIATLYLHDPERFAPAMASLLYQASVLELRPLLWALDHAHADQRHVLPVAVRQTLLERLLAMSDNPLMAPDELIRIAGRIIPDELLAYDWRTRWSSWSWRARQALADALVDAIPLATRPNARDAAGSQLLHLAHDSQFSVRRAAYRGLARLSAAVFLLACAAWATSPFVALRRRAAEALAWMPTPAEPTGPNTMNRLADDMRYREQVMPQVIGRDRRAQAAAERIQARLAADADPIVRESQEHALEDRRRRGQAWEYLRQVDATCDRDDVSNRALLAAWRYGHALTEVGEDETLGVLEQHLATGIFGAHVAQWLRSLRHDVEEGSKKRREGWPKPIHAWSGSSRYMRGTLSLHTRGARGAVAGMFVLCTSDEPEEYLQSLSGVGSNGAFLPDNLSVKMTGGDMEVRLEDGTHGTALLSARLAAGLWLLSTIHLAT